MEYLQALPSITRVCHFNSKAGGMCIDYRMLSAE